MELNKYYGAGLVSTVDRYHENKKAVLAKYPKRRKIEEPKPMYHPDIMEHLEEPVLDIDIEGSYDAHSVEEIRAFDRKVPRVMNMPQSKSRKSKKFKDEESKRKWEEAMTQRRRKLFTSIIKKEISKQHRAKMNKHKEMVLQCKRVATHCQKFHRNRAVSGLK